MKGSNYVTQNPIGQKSCDCDLGLGLGLGKLHHATLVKVLGLGLGFCTRESKRKKFEINKYVSIFRSNSYGSRILRLTQLLLSKYLC